MHLHPITITAPAQHWGKADCGSSAHSVTHELGSEGMSVWSQLSAGIDCSAEERPVEEEHLTSPPAWPHWGPLSRNDPGRTPVLLEGLWILVTYMCQRSSVSGSLTGVLGLLCAPRRLAKTTSQDDKTGQSRDGKAQPYRGRSGK